MKTYLTGKTFVSSIALIGLVCLSGCKPDPDLANLKVNPSIYQPKDFPSVTIRDVTVMDGLGNQSVKTDVLLSGGKIKAIGESINTPVGGIEIDGTGRVLTPGIIDVHTHYGTATLPYANGNPDHWDVNESSSPITPEIRIETAFNPQDPALIAALQGGVTTFQVLPGSRNLIAGLGVVMKNVPSSTGQAMKFPGAPYGLKMACGENPKAYGSNGKPPYTRMGSVAMQREAWAEATSYKNKFWTFGREKNEGLEILSAVLNGDIKVHIHCYRADDMATMIDMSNEFGFKITAFHHAVEAYKIPKLLADEEICSAVWSDWWGWKLEAYDGISENAAFLSATNACVVMHSDIAALGTRLNIEAAKALAAGRKSGLEISKGQALTWITSVPAKMLGIDDRTGSIAVGKNADVVLWSDDPFSVNAHPDQVFIDGALIYDRQDPAYQPKSDFMVGQTVLKEKP